MKNYIFVRNKKYRPSSYYRVCQYISNKSAYIVNYEPDIFYKVNKSNRVCKIIYDLLLQFIPGYINRIINIIKILNTNSEYRIYIQRAIFPKFIDPIGKILLKCLINKSSEIYWDFDDNIIESNEITNFEKSLLEIHADKIIVGNEFLKSRLSKESHFKVELIPTTDKFMEDVDLDKLNELRCKSYDNEINIVWVGTSSNLKFVYNISLYLEKAAFELFKNYNKRLVLNIVCDKKLEYEFKSLQLNNIKWSRDIAIENMKKAHIGIMPLEEDYYTPGKCGFKAVQTIGLGIPTVVSEVGFNKEVITNGYNGFIAYTENEWIESILKLSTDIDNWNLISNNCRLVWEHKFNSKNVEEYLNNILNLQHKEGETNEK